MEITLQFKEEADGTYSSIGDPIVRSNIPEYEDIYWALEDSNNPLHFLFRDNADFLTLAHYLHSCGVSRTRPLPGEWIPVFDPAAFFGQGDMNTIVYYKCSVCGRREPTKEPYCNCGAKMKEE